MKFSHFQSFINPRRIREGYGSHSVCVCVSVCLSVTTLTATNIVCESKLHCDVIRFLMAFQTRDLCGFRRERFIRYSFGVIC